MGVYAALACWGIVSDLGSNFCDVCVRVLSVNTVMGYMGNDNVHVYSRYEIFGRF